MAKKEIADLIETYRLAWNARDFEKMASLFSEPATYIVPSGNLHIPDKDALISKLQQKFVEIEAEGFDHTEIGEVVVTMCNEYAALAELKNLRRLKSDGSEIDAIDALYICVLEEGSWRLSVAMAGDCGWNDKTHWLPEPTILNEDTPETAVSTAPMGSTEASALSRTTKPQQELNLGATRFEH